MPDFNVTYSPDEVRRMEDAQLILAGIQPSELAQMSEIQRYDVLLMKNALEKLKNGELW